MMKFESQAGKASKLTVIGDEFGQCVGWDGGRRGPILGGWADLGQGFVSFLHWTHLLYRLNSAVGRHKQQLVQL